MDDLIAWYQRFWSDRAAGDAEQAIVRREAALGVRLPSPLRAFLREASLRESAVLHLRPLGEIVVEPARPRLWPPRRWAAARVLVFADEVQHCASWGILCDHLNDPDPPLVFGTNGDWSEDGATLVRFLRYFVVYNRCYVAPWAEEPRLPKRLDGWEEVSCGSRYASGSIWVRRDAASDGTETGGIGAKTNEGLREALAALGNDAAEHPESVHFAR